MICEILTIGVGYVQFKIASDLCWLFDGQLWKNSFNNIVQQRNKLMNVTNGSTCTYYKAKVNYGIWC